MTIAIATFAILLVAVALLQRRGPFIQYLTIGRYQALAALTLVGLPPLALLGAPALLGNLFVVGPIDTAIITALTLLASWSVMLSTRLVLMYAAARLDAPPIHLPRWVSRHQVWIFAVLAVPISGVTWLMTSDGRVVRGFGVAAGVVAALGCIGAATWIRERMIAPQDVAPDLLLPTGAAVFRAARRKPAPQLPGWRFLQQLFAILGEGYVAPGAPLPGHLLALSFLVIITLLYFLGYVLVRPDGILHTAVPALAFVLVIIIAATWALSGAAFYLDRYRVPVGLVLVTASLFAGLVFDSDHYYPSFPAHRERNPDQAAAGLAMALTHRMGRTPGPIVVVAANGGGIQAAAWVAKVLTGVQGECPGFADAVAMVSAVSGGSVGTMYFVDNYRPGDFPSDTRSLGRIVAAAEDPSLNELAWGLAYPDLMRTLFPFAVPRTLDRAWALERAWERHLQSAGSRRPRLADWRPGVELGWRPLVVFNATIVENGQRFLFAPIDLPPGFGDSYHLQYPSRDVALVSAVRLSATFPYVTPVARDQEDPGGGTFHIADGGYYDNFGIITALQWIDEVVDTFVRRGGRRILLLEIRSAPYPHYPPPYAPTGGRRGWILDVVGPIEALLQVRSGAQMFRNTRDVDAAAARYKTSHGAAGFEFWSIILNTPKEGPLSWKLTAQDIKDIESAWSAEETRKSVASVKAFLSERCAQ